MNRSDDSKHLSEAERAAWRQAVADVRPLKARRAGEMEIPMAAPPQRQDTRAALPALPPALTIAPVKHSAAPLREGIYEGVDKATARRIRRGQYPIDRTLDLHGLGRQEAYVCLQRAVMQGVLDGQRLLLVITGKGRGGDGVLRRALPQWLQEDGLRPYLLAFDRARPQDGGGGAWYVLLKRLYGRRREDDARSRTDPDCR